MPDNRRAQVKIALILLAAALVYLIGNARVALWDRDEPRYAQTSRQMLQSGDWVVPRLLDQVRTAKPIFIYWCQAAAMSVLGDNESAARLPSVVGMTLTLVVVATVVFQTIGPRHALWTVFTLASSALAIAAAKMCITDAVLLLWVTIAQICLLMIYLGRARLLPSGDLPVDTARQGPRRPRSDVAIACSMWVAIALAGLTKGPVVLGVQLMTMLALVLLDVGRDFHSFRSWLSAIRWWRHTRPILGIVIIALICGPWLYLIEQRAPGFLATSIGHDVIGRTRGALEGHKGPPGYYLLTIWGTYFPWSLLLPATIVWGWRRRINPIHRFALAAIVGPWIMFEIVQTKLAHYVLPVFPFLAFLTADMLIRTTRRKAGPLRTRAFVGAVRGWAIIVVLIGAAPWVALAYFELPGMAIVGMVLLSLVSLEYARSVFVHFNARRPLDAAAFTGAGMLLVVVVMYGIYFPHASFLHISPQIADVLRAEGALSVGDSIMIDYREDTLAFYTNGTIRRESDPMFLLNNPPWEWPRYIVLTDRIWRQMPLAVRAQFDVIGQVRGLWYVKGGRIAEVLVLRKKTRLADSPGMDLRSIFGQSVGKLRRQQNRS